MLQAIAAENMFAETAFVVPDASGEADWQLRWFDDPSDDVLGSSLADALLDVPVLGSPGSDFIFLVMSQAEASGVAPRLLWPS